MAVVSLRFCYRIAASSLAPDATSGQIIGTPLTVQPNSCYEPLDSASTQPYGFDQMAGLYAKYKVLKAHLEVLCAPAPGSDSINTGTTLAVLSQSPTGGATLASTAGDVAAARPNVSIALMSKNEPKTWRRSYNMHELLGVTKQEFDSNVEEYAAAVGANPTQMPTIQLGCFTLGGGSNQTGISCMIFLTQQVQFFGRIGQAAS